MRDRPLLLGTLAVILAACGFGLLGPLARFAYEAGFEPLSFVGWRATFGFLITMVVIAARIRSGVGLVNPLGLARGDAVALLLAGLAGLGLNVAMFFAFDLATVALVLLAFYTYPALVAIVAVALGHERFDANRVVALGLALVGMILVVAGGLGSAEAVSIHPVGIALGFVAAVCQTVYVTVSRGRFLAVPPEQAMGWVLLLTAVACGVLAIAAGNDPTIAFSSPRALAIVVFTGVVAAGIPSVLFLVGIRAIGGTRAGILMLIEPLVGVTLAAFLLHEGLLPIQVAGGASILAAALLIQRGAAGTGGVTATAPSAGPPSRSPLPRAD
ncbi:MAG: EamA family transporter [Chloroflexi bacterium]|nr:EamA family transporter [Chloroflexota bacterium]